MNFQRFFARRPPKADTGSQPPACRPGGQSHRPAEPTDADKALMAEAYWVQGLSQQAIAERFGVSRHTVRKVLKQCEEAYLNPMYSNIFEFCDGSDADLRLLMIAESVPEE